MSDKALDRLRKIKANHQHGKVDGCSVDAMTANAILTVYDALNDINKARLLSLSVPHAAKVAWKLCDVNVTSRRE